MKRYLNYLIFAVVVLLVVGIAVNHSRYVRSLVDAMGSPDNTTRSHAALELVKTEQFSDSITGEDPTVRLHGVNAVLSLANDTSVVAKPTMNAITSHFDSHFRFCIFFTRDAGLCRVVSISFSSDHHITMFFTV